jgi:hypothetical protein
MLLLNFLTPFLVDDYAFATSTSLADVFQKVYQQYFHSNGRSLAHINARIFLMMPKVIFNFINAVIFVGLTLLILRSANPKKIQPMPLYLFIILSIWLFTMNYGQVVLWLTGSTNYLWGMTIILCFLTPYISYINTGKCSNYVTVLGVFILGVIAGWSNENTSGGAILLVVFSLIYCIIFKQKIKIWMIGGLIGCIIGFLFLILAPGNANRSNQFQTDERLPWVILGERMSNLTNILRDNFSVLIIVFIVLMVVQITQNKDWKRVYISFALFIAGIATVYAMVMAPVIAGRALFGATIFMIMACAHGLAGLSLETAPYKIAVVSFMAVLMFQFTTSFIIGFYEIGMTYKVTVERNRFIESEYKRGFMNIVVPNELITGNPTMKYSARYGLGDLMHDTDHWINRDTASYFGLESLRRAD